MLCNDKIRDKIGISLAQFRNNRKWNSKWSNIRHATICKHLRIMILNELAKNNIICRSAVAGNETFKQHSSIRSRGSTVPGQLLLPDDSVRF